MARPSGRPIRDELIDVATQMISDVGVTGFSYGGLAKQLGISAPTIHHHFKTKEDLIAAVAEKYRLDFAESVRQLPTTDPLDQITSYATLFARTAETDSLCLCGAVSADWLAVGERTRAEIEAFFAEQTTWLEARLTEAVESGELAEGLPIGTLASTILSMLEGSLLIARANGDAGLPVDITALLTHLVRTGAANV